MFLDFGSRRVFGSDPLLRHQVGLDPLDLKRTSPKSDSHQLLDPMPFSTDPLTIRLYLRTGETQRALCGDLAAPVSTATTSASTGKPIGSRGSFSSGRTSTTISPL